MLSLLRIYMCDIWHTRDGYVTPYVACTSYANQGHWISRWVWGRMSNISNGGMSPAPLHIHFRAAHGHRTRPERVEVRRCHCSLRARALRVKRNRWAAGLRPTRCVLTLVSRLQRPSPTLQPYTATTLTSHTFSISLGPAQLTASRSPTIGATKYAKIGRSAEADVISPLTACHDLDSTQVCGQLLASISFSQMLCPS